MNRRLLATCQLFLLLLVTAVARGEIVELEWDDLLPENGPEPFLTAAEMNESAADTPGVQASSQMLADMIAGGEGSISDLLIPNPEYSTAVRADLNDKEVRLPGFVVPLETDDVGNVRTFFLVPYFGACIHVPPPPPNQLVYITAEEPFPLSSIYDPFWIEGVIRVESTENLVGASGYSMDMSKIEIYEY